MSVPAHLHRSLAPDPSTLVCLSPYPRARPQPRTCFGTLLRDPRPYRLQHFSMHAFIAQVQEMRGTAGPGG